MHAISLLRIVEGVESDDDFSSQQRMKSHSKIKTDPNGRAAYRLREASELTGIPVSTFRKKIRRGDLNPITGFGVWLIAADDLEALLNKRLRNTRSKTAESHES